MVSISIRFLTLRNNLNLVTAEIKNPKKNLPRSILYGLVIVIFCYLIANIAYYSRLSFDVVTGSTSLAMVSSTK
jgi:amino acid transporter